ncbi:MAG: RtcB family protein [Pseudomonadota bacterium]
MAKKTTTSEPAPYALWGEDLDPDAVQQMDDACSLPIAVRGALMPDAHKGYGLPIGGVLAVTGAVIPYAVGVDIACRMKLSVLDVPVRELEDNHGSFKIALETRTRFGVGEEFSRPMHHRVMDEDWSFCPLVASLKDRAAKQLGTSGSGNHFAEFGELVLDNAELGLEPGQYLALMTHSGSRGTGAEIAGYYSNLAKRLHPELPRHLNDLAWLGLDQAEGQDYWRAMELMGRYSSANHEVIHRNVLHDLGAGSLLTLENHHNFAWTMTLDSREVIVHRKGATPAHAGALGIIPGSMASPAFIVRGKGNENSLFSAAHGAGRRMSRNAAMARFQWQDLNAVLQEKGVTLISAGLDEVPMAYKDIEAVMAQQQDLVEILARFQPRLVKMSPPEKKRRKRR